jgi:hypothetical protein
MKDFRIYQSQTRASDPLFLAQNAMWWTEIVGLGGFRLDTFPYSTRQFWSGWHERLHLIYPRMSYPQVMDVGEVADPDYTVTAKYISRYRLGASPFSAYASVAHSVGNHIRKIVLENEPPQAPSATREPERYEGAFLCQSSQQLPSSSRTWKSSVPGSTIQLVAILVSSQS